MSWLEGIWLAGWAGALSCIRASRPGLDVSALPRLFGAVTWTSLVVTMSCALLGSDGVGASAAWAAPTPSPQASAKKLAATPKACFNISFQF